MKHCKQVTVARAQNIQIQIPDGLENFTNPSFIVWVASIIGFLKQYG